MTTLLVDWLGRGGIAQCTESWAIELDAAGIDVVVATRAGRELAATPLPTVTADGRGRLAAHRHLVAATVEAIRQRRPDTVVVQNFLIPSMEQAVHRAAR
ncbi:MAG TPA: hypothetical protein VHK88_14300, partial [Aquihabitans sp.]|nr:hypothetical protein [Aquihabitans sp.]